MNYTMKALLLVVPMLTATSVLAADCPEWMTWGFWKDATGEAVRGCLAQGANLNARDDKYDGTPLHWAAWEGNADAVSALLKAGANHNARDVNGRTPLHGAAWYGKADAVLALLKAGADHNARDERGWTPLHRAAWYGKADAVLALLKAGADPIARDKSGNTPFDLAKMSGYLKGTLKGTDAYRRLEDAHYH